MNASSGVVHTGLLLIVPFNFRGEFPDHLQVASPKKVTNTSLKSSLSTCGPIEGEAGLSCCNNRFIMVTTTNGVVVWKPKFVMWCCWGLVRSDFMIIVVISR